MRECNFCKRKADKLYEFRGWKICWDCYFKKVDEAKANLKSKERDGTYNPPPI